MFWHDALLSALDAVRTSAALAAAWVAVTLFKEALRGISEAIASNAAQKLMEFFLQAVAGALIGEAVKALLERAGILKKKLVATADGPDDNPPSNSPGRARRPRPPVRTKAEMRAALRVITGGKSELVFVILDRILNSIQIIDQNIRYKFRDDYAQVLSAFNLSAALYLRCHKQLIFSDLGRGSRTDFLSHDKLSKGEFHAFLMISDAYARKVRIAAAEGLVEFPEHRPACSIFMTRTLGATWNVISRAISRLRIRNAFSYDLLSTECGNCIVTDDRRARFVVKAKVVSKLLEGGNRSWIDCQSYVGERNENRATIVALKRVHLLLYRGEHPNAFIAKLSGVVDVNGSFNNTSRDAVSASGFVSWARFSVDHCAQQGGASGHVLRVPAQTSGRKVDSIKHLALGSVGDLQQEATSLLFVIHGNIGADGMIRNAEIVH